MTEPNYFDQVPIWGNESGYNFRVMADDFSGRIPVTRLDRWQDLAEVLESDFFNRTGVQHIFRGHRRYDWSLSPTLARLNSVTNIIDEQMADNQLELFRRAVRGRLMDRTLVDEGEEDELWAVGQHHGLMTPLLDWTHSPYVALFFAFAGEDATSETDNAYRAIYVLNKTFVGDDDLCPDIRLLEPRKDDHGRLVNQAGLFTFSPYGATIENNLTDILSDDDFPDDELKNAAMHIDPAEEELNGDEPQGGDAESEVLAKYICKIYIKNEERDGCLRHLRRMNVHHASLFPDLIGASEYCNLLMADESDNLSSATDGTSEIVEEIFGSGFRLSTAEKTAVDIGDVDAEKEMTVFGGSTRSRTLIIPLSSEKIKTIAAAVSKNDQPPNGRRVVAGSENSRINRGSVMEVVSSHITPKQMLPGRMIEMSREISAEIQRNAVVDWEKRETVMARMRNGIRVILRKEGCPIDVRDVIADQVMEQTLRVKEPELVTTEPSKVNIPTLTTGLQLEFWKQFRKYVLESSSVMRPQKPGARHWMNFAIGTSKAHAAALLNTRDCLISVSLQVNKGKDRLAIFNLLEQDKDAIESEVGDSLVWEEKPQNKNSHIILRNPNLNPNNKSSWPDIHQWMLKKLEKFREVFCLRIKSIDPGDWQPEDVSE